MSWKTMNRCKQFGLVGGVVVTVGLLVLGGSPEALAQCQHGASIFKTCQSRQTPM